MTAAKKLSAVKEHPILFSAPMVRAILEGRKTQTRRVVKPVPEHWTEPRETCATTPEGWQTLGSSGRWSCQSDTGREVRACPYGQPGDRLWVRETWARVEEDGYPAGLLYRATDTVESEPEDLHGGRWRPSIHMPRWASRITLELTDVRVERLQGISEEDARAEGVHSGESLAFPGTLCFQDYLYGKVDRPDDWFRYATHSFASLWDSINADRPGCSWNDNPWVWALSFRRIQP